MIGKYTDLISKFLEKGYKDIFFNELSSEYNQLIIRHDIDFDCEFAYEMAKIEYNIGVKSTYFFMLSNSIYNLFSEKNREYVRKIKTLGHKISVHFDFQVGDLKKEIDIFESFFDTEVDIVSIHRPNLELVNQIDVEHTYLSKYFKDIKYFADSRGRFRFGHPLESKEFQESKSIHLLIHPVWWMSDKKDVIDIMENIIDRNHEMNKKFFRENSIPYREHSDD